MLSLLNPVVLFFVLGAFAGVIKSDLRIPKDFYHTLSIYLLLSIGIKGGIELFHTQSPIWGPAAGTIVLGGIITVLAMFILQRVGRFNRTDAIAIATHYGSVSAVTFAVVLSYLSSKGIFYEQYSTVLLVLLEIPAIGVGILLAKLNPGSGRMQIGKLLHEVFLGKTILLLIGGLLIGLLTAYTHNEDINFFFLGLFKGFLAIFMLEMGIVTSERFGDLKKVGLFLLVFGMAMPIVSAMLGIAVGMLVGLSLGGTVVLATMAASASYIAAPAAMKIALPDANATFYLTSSLGITFPFNILIGIPLYHHMAEFMMQQL
ncbi:sodium-dependent bicarbonate transport family permease [Pontibacter sp. CAU 1760]